MGRVGEGESRTNWEIRTDGYTLPCVKWMARDKQLYSTESSAQRSVMARGVRWKSWAGGSRESGYTYAYG